MHSLDCRLGIYELRVYGLGLRILGLSLLSLGSGIWDLIHRLWKFWMPAVWVGVHSFLCLGFAICGSSDSAGGPQSMGLQSEDLIFLFMNS